MHKNPKYLKFVRTLPCSYCGNPDTEPHHIIEIGDGIMGAKASDIHSMPLCRKHHDEVHKDPFQWPQALWVIRTQNRAVEAGYL